MGWALSGVGIEKMEREFERLDNEEPYVSRDIIRTDAVFTEIEKEKL